MPTVSVVIPVYKIPEKYLRTCIESITNQTLNDIEIVLVDDGSPDNCGAICDEYAAKDSKVIVVHQENKGASAARNAGALMATGRYMAFVDGDDWLESNTLEIAVSAIEKHNVDIVMWAISQDFGESSKTVFRFFEQDTMIDNHTKLREYSLYRTDSKKKKPPIDALGSHVAKLYLREVFIANNLLFNTGLAFGEDSEYCLRLSEYVKTAYYIAKPLYHFRFNEQSSTRKYDPDFSLKYKKSVGVMFDYISEKPEREFLLPSLSLAACVFLLSCGANSIFHAENKQTLRQKLAYSKQLAQNEPFKYAVEHVRLSVLPLSHIIPLLFIRHKFYFGFYLVCKARQLQVRLRLNKQ